MIYLIKQKDFLMNSEILKMQDNPFILRRLKFIKLEAISNSERDQTTTSRSEEHTSELQSH